MGSLIFQIILIIDRKHDPAISLQRNDTAKITNDHRRLGDIKIKLHTEGKLSKERTRTSIVHFTTIRQAENKLKCRRHET